MTGWLPPGRLGLGGAPLGNLFSPVTEADADATLRAAWDSGVRLFDTAPLYGAGLSEHRIGTFLRTKPRETYTVCTKVGRLLDPDLAAPEVRDGYVGGLPFSVRFDYSADATQRSIEDSLQRLGTARLDAVWIHDPAEDAHGPAWRDRLDEALSGAVPVLERLREQGVVHAWGLGTNRVEPCLVALERTRPDAMLLAGRYTLLDGTGLDELLPACARSGVAVVLGGPFNSGLLAGGQTYEYADAPPDMARRAHAIAQVCSRFGVDVKAAALQFCLAGPAVSAILTGARTAAEITENADLARRDIPPELWQELRAHGLLRPDAPVPA